MQGTLRIGPAFSAAGRAFQANAGALIVGGIYAGLVTIFTLCIGAPAMTLGYYRMCLRALRGEKVEVGDINWGWSMLGPGWLVLLLTMIIEGVLQAPGQAIMHFAGQQSAVGLLSLVVVQILAMMVGVCAIWANYLMADGDRDAVGCLLQSFRSVWPRFWSVLGYGIVCGLVMYAGLAALGIGFLVSMPIGSLMIAHGFTQMFGSREQPVVATFES